MTTSTSRLTALTVAGDTVEYTDTGGEGPAVLLIHGGVFGDGFADLAASPALDGFRVVRIVRAGYTAGPAPTHHVTMGDHAAHAAALLDHLGIAHAHVVGHSSGSAIGMQLGLDRPDLVDSLVLGEPPLVDPADREFVEALIGPELGRAVAAAESGDAAAGLDAFLSAVCEPGYREVVTATLGADAFARAERGARFFLTDEVVAVARWTFDAAAAARLTVPVVLVQGGNSVAARHRLVARTAGMLPNAKTVVVDGDDHLLFLRNPDLLGHLVAQFVARRTPAA